MATQRARRLANRGKRRPPLPTAHPWWWDYPRLQRRYNPYRLDWLTLRRLPTIDEQRAFVEEHGRMIHQVIHRLTASGGFHYVN